MTETPNDLLARQVGLNDEPLQGLDEKQELLQIGEYYLGLASFISKCSTPMTIAIQGSWGSGKTSAINFVKNYLQDSAANSGVRPIVFNTWQYSQFDLGEELIYALMEQLATLIASKDSGAAHAFKDKVRELIGPLVRNSVSVAASLLGGPAVGDGVARVYEELAKSGQNGPNLASQLEDLCDNFQKGVEEYCDATDADRLAIFIDDLDRLDPSRAVQLMECLKIFLDSPRCVFVLAIDFEVVAQGVATRYSSFSQHYDTGKLTELARSFFDKIIQVPFSMPTHDYDVDSLVSSHLRRIGVEFSNSEIEDLVSAIKMSIGPNPRSIKRLLNSFELLEAISGLKGTLSDPQNSRRALITLILLCAQASFPGLHRDISDAVTRGREGEVSKFFVEVRNGPDLISGDKVEATSNWKVLGFEYIRLGGWSDSIEPTDEFRIAEFLTVLARVLIPDGGSDEFDVELLRSAMLLSGLTSRESLDGSDRFSGDCPAARYLEAKLARVSALRSDIRISRGRDSIELFMANVDTSSHAMVSSESEVSIADFYIDRVKVKAYFGPDQKIKDWKEFVEDSSAWSEFEDHAFDEYSSSTFPLDSRAHGRAIAMRDIRTDEEVELIVDLILSAGGVMTGSE